MSSQWLGVIELGLVYGAILGWAGWQWWDWRKWRQRQDRERRELERDDADT